MGVHQENSSGNTERVMLPDSSKNFSRLYFTLILTLIGSILMQSKLSSDQKALLESRYAEVSNALDEELKDESILEGQIQDLQNSVLQNQADEQQSILLIRALMSATYVEAMSTEQVSELISYVTSFDGLTGAEQFNISGELVKALIKKSYTAIMSYPDGTTYDFKPERGFVEVTDKFKAIKFEFADGTTFIVDADYTDEDLLAYTRYINSTTGGILNLNVRSVVVDGVPSFIVEMAKPGSDFVDTLVTVRTAVDFSGIQEFAIAGHGGLMQVEPEGEQSA